MDYSTIQRTNHVCARCNSIITPGTGMIITAEGIRYHIWCHITPKCQNTA